MQQKGSERIGAAALIGCALFFGACITGSSQPVTPPITRPPPTFNPSSPYTVPQPAYKPIGSPSIGSGAGVSGGLGYTHKAVTHSSVAAKHHAKHKGHTRHH